MNKQRTSYFNSIVTLNGVTRTQEVYNLSKINITDYWLLGLIEGEGSFHLIRTRLIPVFSTLCINAEGCYAQKWL